MEDQFLEELEVLTSIYGEDQLKICEATISGMEVSYGDDELGISIAFSVPLDYPSRQVPAVIVRTKSLLRRSFIESAVVETINLGREQGEVVLYSAIEKLRELMIEDDDASSPASSSSKIDDVALTSSSKIEDVALTDLWEKMVNIPSIRFLSFPFPSTQLSLSVTPAPPRW